MAWEIQVGCWENFLLQEFETASTGEQRGGGSAPPQVWLDKANGHPQLAPVVAFLSAEGLFHTTALSQT